MAEPTCLLTFLWLFKFRYGSSHLRRSEAKLKLSKHPEGDTRMSVQSAQGLDVSNYQGKFNWSAVTGLSFGIYRMTQGLGQNTNSPDPDAAWNNAQLKTQALIRGAYHFFDPTLSGAAQAQYFVTQRSLIGLNSSDMLWLDHETAGTSPADTSAAAAAFMTE